MFSTCCKRFLCAFFLPALLTSNLLHDCVPLNASVLFLQLGNIWKNARNSTRQTVLTLIQQSRRSYKTSNLRTTSCGNSRNTTKCHKTRNCYNLKTTSCGDSRDTTYIYKTRNSYNLRTNFCNTGADFSTFMQFWLWETMTLSGGLIGLIYAGYVPLAYQNPYSIIVYSVAKYRPHLSHFWENDFSRSQLSNFCLCVKKPFNQVILK